MFPGGLRRLPNRGQRLDQIELDVAAAVFGCNFPENDVQHLIQFILRACLQAARKRLLFQLVEAQLASRLSLHVADIDERVRSWHKPVIQRQQRILVSVLHLVQRLDQSSRTDRSLHAQIVVDAANDRFERLLLSFLTILSAPPVDEQQHNGLLMNERMACFMLCPYFCRNIQGGELLQLPVFRVPYGARGRCLNFFRCFTLI
ncbi:hypothetical protein D1872_257660 [compost metagenome]